ncbi:endonuclease domain-containing protein [Sphingosinicella sp. BN140058]|nr:endonuclease domain-containing protein [Sphingosinicella sp. BN140058]
MRRDPTEPEKRLWRHLSNSQLQGFKFRRQAVMDPFIADFFCPAKALIIEVDGDTHDAAADRRRDGLLSTRGFTIIRFTNQDVMTNMDGVLITILDRLRALPDRWAGRTELPHPNPSPEGEGLLKAG